MQAASRLISLAIVLLLYAAYFRLAARILRASRVGWVYSLQFAALVVLLSIGIRLGAVHFGAEAPLLVGLTVGIALHLSLGAWFFRSRALAAGGEPLGWLGGAKLTAIAFALFGVTVAVLIGGARALLSVAAP